MNVLFLCQSVYPTTIVAVDYHSASVNGARNLVPNLADHVIAPCYYVSAPICMVRPGGGIRGLSIRDGIYLSEIRGLSIRDLYLLGSYLSGMGSNYRAYIYWDPIYPGWDLSIGPIYWDLV